MFWCLVWGVKFELTNIHNTVRLFLFPGSGSLNLPSLWFRLVFVLHRKTVDDFVHLVFIKIQIVLLKRILVKMAYSCSITLFSNRLISEQIVVVCITYRRNHLKWFSRLMPFRLVTRENPSYSLKIFKLRVCRTIIHSCSYIETLILIWI